MSRKKPKMIVRLFNKQSGECAYCGEKMFLHPRFESDPLAATKDHVIPRSKGGFSYEWNYVAACRQCNCQKSDMPLRDFLVQKFPKTFDMHPLWMHPSLMMDY